jgi:hypothetical protein
MLEYLMFGTYRCDFNQNLIISYPIVAQIEGVSLSLVQNKNYVAKVFLDAFSNDIIPLNIEEYSYVDGKARTVSIHFPAPLQNLLISEYNARWKNDQRVYFVSGKPFTVASQRKTRKGIQMFSQTLVSHHEKTNDLLTYMNNLPESIFKKLDENMDNAIIIAAQNPNERGRNHQLNILRAIKDQFQPFYQPAPSSTRIFGVNESLLSLKRDVRKALCKGWYDCDLRYVQLAVTSKLWDLPFTRYVIEHTSGPWNYFSATLGLTDDDVFQNMKDVAKKLLYAAIYGMSKGRLAQEAKRMFSDIDMPEAAERFMQCEMIIEILQKRDLMHRRAKTEPVIDAFGVTLTGKPLSMLARQAQSYELRLLWPIIEYAKRTTALTVTAFIHDGLLADISRNTEENVMAMKALVDAEAKALGICTELEVSLL